MGSPERMLGRHPCYLQVWRMLTLAKQQRAGGALRDGKVEALGSGSYPKVGVEGQSLLPDVGGSPKPGLSLLVYRLQGSNRWDGRMYWNA